MFSFRKHFSTVLTEEIRIEEFCTEMFLIPKHLMIKLNTVKSLYFVGAQFSLFRQQ